MRLGSLIAAIAFLMTVGSSVMAEEPSKCITKLTGFQETPPILTNASGTFRSKLDKTGTSLSYVLNFSGLSSPATVVHIHFGQAGAAGAPIAFLCGGGNKPACPVGGGTVTGMIIASDILPVPAQGINGGNFSDFLAVVHSGKAYVNVHSTMYPAGEIRGQIKKSIFN